MSGRIYNYVREVDDVLPRLLQDPELDIPTQVSRGSQTIDDDDPLNDLPKLLGSETHVIPLNYFRDLKNWTAIAKAADSAYNAIQDERREDRRTGHFAETARRINSLAAALSIRNSTPESLPTAIAQLAAAVVSISDRLADIFKDNPNTLEHIDASDLDDAARKLKQLADR